MEDDTGPLPLPLPLPPLTAATAPERQLPWTVRLRHKLPQYLPVLLLGAIAAATGWLVRQTPSGDEAPSVAIAASEPDYEMRGFSVQHYTRTGPAQGVIEGDRVRHFPATDQLVIDGARVRWTDAAGHLVRAAAPRAVAEGDGSRVRLEGGARVEREPVEGEPGPLVFTSEVMVFDTRAGRIRSDLPVRLSLGESRFDASTLDYDHTSRVVVLDGRVRGLIDPTGAGAGGRADR
ncbi:LPS export ABC transporter periplasmic protein LptC [Leptothrix discophora]|uniref:LPS export ABC transporter periplasmic protein LptC n=1 Tax=Leptothrix discophora TaxID=89 RepID=A0ABT9G3R7_LEPDI|nr:LPS export ABC transporter periplasmic protein LptC [Leptothrix discophora]MDP4301130.1 LPS export ABC transporter periplasmic protein LptC [Leptothrix discophora]